ncbi:amino acid ABC transporter substrate-binding protein [Streptomyces sp. NPDC049590]|uniref:amino acid ABC transporter substrate-binding protein n=1 Tax=Streptomyces sp. NPDC049590 TaxID=3154834 RepID=UPI003431D278
MPRWRKILYALLVTAALVAGGLFGWSFLHRPDMCDSGVERIGHECVGVNGDGYAFENPAIRDVAAAIKKQNDEVTNQPYVTVAVMMPFYSRDKALQRQIRSDLLGAYLGQLKANQGEGKPPKIRLVLANPGPDYQYQDKVVSTLVKMAKSPEDRLRAVTGINLSLAETEAAVRRLTRNHVPVLASRITGDGIANKEVGDYSALVKPKFPGLARIIPTNREVAEALAQFNDEQGRDDARTVVVFDKRKDSYNVSLANAFRQVKERGSGGDAAQTFTSEGIGKPGNTGNTFARIAISLCDSKADTVYFAGRAVHLRLFALELARANCQKPHYTVISGSDAASLRQYMRSADWEELRGGQDRPKVTVQYAAPAHPEAWKIELAGWKKRWAAAHDGRAPGAKDLPQYLVEPQQALDDLRKLIDSKWPNGARNNLLGAPPDLEDSRTMLVYDGLLTIDKAVHLNGDGKVPELADLGDHWAELQSTFRVQGTSGLICLTTAGNPYDKPIAVVELDPGDKGQGRLKYVGLGWPDRKPQSKGCVIPDVR